MLRRRKRSPKPDLRPRPTPDSRRRARPDTPVPPEVRIVAGRSGAGVVLVTGFEPFGGERTNPSWEICRMLPGTIAGLRVEAVNVPCEFGRAIDVVARAIERHRPALVVCLGQAGGRSHMSVER